MAQIIIVEKNMIRVISYVISYVLYVFCTTICLVCSV